MARIPNIVSQGVYSFVHILMPHPPFLFDRYGNPKTPAKDCYVYDVNDIVPGCMSPAVYRVDYAESLRYLNKRIIESLKETLRHHPDVLVILHSDHGPGSTFHKSKFRKSALKERYSILLGVRMPENAKKRGTLPDSPVNIFRWLSSNVLEDPIEQLPYRAYFFENYIDRIDVTNLWGEAEET